MCPNFMFLDRLRLSFYAKNTHTQMHTQTHMQTHSDEYSIVAFCKTQL